MTYDVAIIGTGAAGYTAAIYAARYQLSVYLVGDVQGGLGLTAAEVGNWPGEQHITGPDLMDKFKAHATSFPEVTLQNARVEKLEKNNGIYTLVLTSGVRIDARSIILAMGSKKRHLHIPGEDRLSGKGVTYCATCDAFFYRNKIVTVIGGGDSAVEGAAIAAQVASKVYLVHRRDSFRAEPYWISKVKENPKIECVLVNEVTEILGESKVTGVRLKEPWQGNTELTTDGVFIEIGADPSVELAVSIGCALDPQGYLLVDANQSSSVPGIFGAGDLTSNSNHFAQFVTAAGEAAVAVNGVFGYLKAGHN